MALPSGPGRRAGPPSGPPRCPATPPRPALSPERTPVDMPPPGGVGAALRTSWHAVRQPPGGHNRPRVRYRTLSLQVPHRYRQRNLETRPDRCCSPRPSTPSRAHRSLVHHTHTHTQNIPSCCLGPLAPLHRDVAACDPGAFQLLRCPWTCRGRVPSRRSSLGSVLQGRSRVSPVKYPHHHSRGGPALSPARLALAHPAGFSPLPFCPPPATPSPSNPPALPSQLATAYPSKP